MKRKCKVKIIATLGPSSFSSAMIEKLFIAGADVFCLNMSHTDHETMYDWSSAYGRLKKSFNGPSVF
ncbi:pyruvate kinase [Bartonella callosciuri]|uniref:Pyruvate kinase n=1 Tax=Bartonella callosciuri TaxID=686223 RepID=A0A840NRN5_9HYPH|nr:pyruvate kinase [Bartonella callosciuri]